MQSNTTVRLGCLLLTLSLAMLVVSSSNQHVAAQDDPIRVVATTGQVGDLVRVIGGDRLEVTTLMGPGIDPHLFQPSAGDVDVIANAEIVFYNGLFLEAKVGEVFERMGDRITTVAVGEAVPEEMRIVVGTGEGTWDPHVWFDPELWAFAAQEVQRTLTEYDPDHASSYEERTAAFLEELETLDAYVAEQAALVPEEQRVLVTAHDAFGYFALAYGFEVLGIQGISTVAEAGTGDIREVADVIVERQIPAIFVETTISPQSIEALQEAVRDRGFEVVIGGSIYSDAMGDEDTPEGTYLGMVRHNIDTIVAALAPRDDS